MGSLHSRLAKPATAIVLTASIVIAALGLVSLQIGQNYQAALVAGELKAQSSADIVAAHTEWMLEASDQALRRIDTAIGSLSLGTEPAAVADIRVAVGDLPEGFVFSVYDSSGNLRLSNVSEHRAGNIAERTYFQDAKRGMQLTIAPRIVDEPGGTSWFIVARRITREGDFRGLATIAIPTDRMDRFWSFLGLGPASTVALVRLDGWVIARHPDLHEPLNISSSRVFELVKESEGGTYGNANSPADGVSRIVGYRQVGHWPVVAMAGIASHEVLERFWDTFILQLTFGLPVLVLLVGFAIWVAWLLRAYAARNIELEAAIERNRFLFREIHHRVKNNLQAISSLVRLQPMPETIRADMARRIAAMVAVHEHIYQSDQFEHVEIAPYLERLVHEIAKSYRSEVEIRMDLAHLIVDRDLMLPVGMVVNEVVSNAFKYAFPTPSEGVLSIRLVEMAQGEAELTIRDNGPGMDLEGKKGMGSKLIVGFVSQIGGRYSFSNEDGTVFAMTFPQRLGERRAGDGEAVS